MDKLSKWAENPSANDEEASQWAKDALTSGCDGDGVPLLFSIPLSTSLVNLLQDNDVDLTARDRSGKVILFDDTYFGEGVFSVLADYFEAKGLIDAADYEGLTPLSSYVKLGDYQKSRILLQHGATPNSVARISRYGGASLSVVKQAILALDSSGDNDNERVKIELLSLLKGYGMAISEA
ncbi:MAG: hypothetical protein Q4G24_16255 [Paracoccus sp. (in: a-proteobacteria)]|uniref:hypothetical protein n=1 Tax=Paracoccus sp. TaxID=267 RepID=UPI0026E06221|nr:hypothetical protein [Paracoccus sp. (in: a-proteobacteria)]MDO5622999.1 hypothetical protein [Paracoccus sp. (in: a-proteobacteria)]